MKMAAVDAALAALPDERRRAIEPFIRTFRMAVAEWRDSFQLFIHCAPENMDERDQRLYVAQEKLDRAIVELAFASRACQTTEPT